MFLLLLLLGIGLAYMLGYRLGRSVLRHSAILPLEDWTAPQFLQWLDKQGWQGEYDHYGKLMKYYTTVQTPLGNTRVEGTRLSELLVNIARVERQSALLEDLDV